jgi:O-acetyl-ADP-ribose deacetylase (regulator of RNase III)
MLDALFADDALRRPTVTLKDVLRGLEAPMRVGVTVVPLWRGDITTLEVGAIVNAANADLLGCFRPDHRCIDNAIHSAAGPRLREDCHVIMSRQRHPERTGTAKATRAYFLPARFVLHTVGPIVGAAAPTETHRVLLASCYEACLAAAVEIGARSLAFCAISTGVFGYPKQEAANEAIRSVTTWLEGHPGRLDAVIFNVFTEDDEEAYRRVGTWR